MILDVIKEILVDLLNVSADEINMETKLIEDLGADSIDKAELVTSLEDKFNIIVDYDKAIDVKTIGDIVVAIESMTKSDIK